MENDPITSDLTKNAELNEKLEDESGSLSAAQFFGTNNQAASSNNDWVMLKQQSQASEDDDAQ